MGHSPRRSADEYRGRPVRTKLSVCRRKRDYPSAAAALDAAGHAGLPLRPYACDRCGRFHLTGRTKGKWLAGTTRATAPDRERP